MDFETLLKNRRSIREFQNKEVSLSIIIEIIEDTRLSPTASNGQPCRFIIIQDRGLIKRISDESKKSILENLVRNPNLPLKQYEVVLRDETFNVFYNAPSLVLLVGATNVSSLDVDCGLTAAYFMFSATARGLGSCWIGLGAHARDRKILDEIGVPEGCRIVAPIIIGYPVTIPLASERRAPDILKTIPGETPMNL
jgi:nitroreductase